MWFPREKTVRPASVCQERLCQRGAGLFNQVRGWWSGEGHFRTKKSTRKGAAGMEDVGERGKWRRWG